MKTSWTQRAQASDAPRDLLDVTDKTELSSDLRPLLLNLRQRSQRTWWSTRSSQQLRVLKVLQTLESCHRGDGQNSVNFLVARSLIENAEIC